MRMCIGLWSYAEGACSRADWAIPGPDESGTSDCGDQENSTAKTLFIRKLELILSQDQYHGKHALSPDRCNFAAGLDFEHLSKLAGRRPGAEAHAHLKENRPAFTAIPHQRQRPTWNPAASRIDIAKTALEEPIKMPGGPSPTTACSLQRSRSRDG